MHLQGHCRCCRRSCGLRMPVQDAHRKRVDDARFIEDAIHGVLLCISELLPLLRLLRRLLCLGWLLLQRLLVWRLLLLQRLLGLGQLLLLQLLLLGLLGQPLLQLVLGQLLLLWQGVPLLLEHLWLQGLLLVQLLQLLLLRGL